jgi:hypothetical protein
VVKRKAFLAALLALGSALAVAPPASAVDARAPAAGTTARERATNQEILAALLQRRAAVAADRGHSEGKRSALHFLDRQIAKVKAELGA